MEALLGSYLIINTWGFHPPGAIRSGSKSLVKRLFVTFFFFTILQEIIPPRIEVDLPDGARSDPPTIYNLLSHPIQLTYNLLETILYYAISIILYLIKCSKYVALSGFRE